MFDVINATRYEIRQEQCNSFIPKLHKRSSQRLRRSFLHHSFAWNLEEALIHNQSILYHLKITQGKYIHERQMCMILYILYASDMRLEKAILSFEYYTTNPNNVLLALKSILHHLTLHRVSIHERWAAYLICIITTIGLYILTIILYWSYPCHPLPWKISPISPI